MKVYVGNDPIVKNNPVCQGPITPDAKWENVDVTCSLVGRYVGIALGEQNYLQIGEVELWELAGAVPTPTPTHETLTKLSTTGLAAS